MATPNPAETFPQAPLAAANFLKFQANFLAQLENLGAAWLTRRQEALHDLHAYAESLANSKSPEDFFAAGQTLLTNSVTRLSGDLAAFQQASAGLLQAQKPPPQG